MMDYMYRGEVNISQDQLAALLKAAESLQIKGLSDNKPSRPPSRPPPAPAHPPRAPSPPPQVSLFIYNEYITHERYRELHLFYINYESLSTANIFQVKGKVSRTILYIIQLWNCILKTAHC